MTASSSELNRSQSTRLAVAVVVTILNESKTIGSLLEALAAQTCPPDEIILADGGSTDGTLALVQAYQRELPALRLLGVPGSNISQGRNAAIASSDCLLIAVTDAGCRPSPMWLACLLAPFEAAGTDLVCGSYRMAPQTNFEESVGRCSGTDWLCVQEQWVRPTTRSLAFTRSAWEAVGGFPEQVYAGEDLWFVLTLADSGHRLHAAPKAVVDWRPRSSYRALLRQFYLYARDTVRGGLTWRIFGRTLAQDAILAGLVLWGLVLPGPLPWLLLLGMIAAYLYRKARQGCFAAPGWRTLYRVPLILIAIHLGVTTGIVVGLFSRTCTRLLKL